MSEGQLESVWQLIEVLSPPYKQSLIKSTLAATSREVSDSAMGLKLPDNTAYGGHRNMKVSGAGLVALRLSMLGYNFVSELLRQLSCFLSFLHAHCGAHSDTKQQNDSFSVFKLVE